MTPFNTKSCIVHRPTPSESAPTVELKPRNEPDLDYNRWPLTIMWLLGKEKEVDFTSDMVPLGIIPWRIDVHTKLETAMGKPLPFLRVLTPETK